MRTLLVMILLLLLGAPAASAAPAHSELVSSSPANGSVVATAPTEIVLTFNETINPQFVQVALTRDAGPVALPAPTVSGPTVRLSGLAVPGAGEYRVAYRVVSADGHPISGTVAFRVTASSTSSANPGPGPSPTTTPAAVPTSAPRTTAVATTSERPPVGAAVTDDSGFPWVWSGLALLVVAAGLLWLGRRSRSTP